MIRVAVNGFGRIGRVVTKELVEREGIEVVAVNDLAPIDTLAHLFAYDSVHGRYPNPVRVTNGSTLVIGEKQIQVYSERDPVALPWGTLDIDVVIESTGLFRDREKASAHLDAGAKRVIISAPPKGSDVKTVVLGVNDSILDGSEKIISNASCTTNSAAPLVAVVQQLTQVDTAFITTVHAYTSDQRLHDAPHADLRRARAAAQSIIPTTTGAAKAITRIFPQLEGKMGGAGIRVPVPDGSLTDMTFVVNEPNMQVADINQAFRKAAEEGPLKGILEYTEDPIVSRDVIGNPHSCVFDAQLTSVIGNMVKVVGWYDNEVGYSNRLADLIPYWIGLGKS